MCQSVISFLMRNENSFFKQDYIFVENVFFFFHLQLFKVSSSRDHSFFLYDNIGNLQFSKYSVAFVRSNLFNFVHDNWDVHSLFHFCLPNKTKQNYLKRLPKDWNILLSYCAWWWIVQQAIYKMLDWVLREALKNRPKN